MKERRVRLASFETGDGQGWGIVDGAEIIPMQTHWPSLRDALDNGVGAIRNASQEVTARLPAQEVRWRMPIPEPRKIICVGVNYAKHVQESGRGIPAQPSLFIRFADSFVGHGEQIVKPKVSQMFDFEAELAVVIGKEAWQVGAAGACDYIAGYTCLSDNSVRDFQKHSAQVTAGKNFLRSGGIGPWMVTPDEAPALENMTVVCRLNGTEVQNGRVRDMIFPVHQLIAYISTFTVLKPGDIIATGTPEGVGALRTPPLWMKAGDELEVEIPGVGTLRNRVAD